MVTKKHIGIVFIGVLVVKFFISCQTLQQKTTLDRANTSKIDRPNVLFISVDDLNDWIEPLGGHSQAKTPNLNRLAKKSVLFTHAYSSNPACNPSRAAILSGLASHTTGHYSNYQDWREIIKDYRSLGGNFRDNGYWAAGAGKLYHYLQVDTTAWNEYWPSQAQNMPMDFPPDRFAKPSETKNEKTVSMPMFEGMYSSFDWAPLDAPDSSMGDYKSVEWVSSQLNKRRDRPFFLACGIYKPHLPWYVPKKYFDLFPLDSIKIPEVLENDLNDVGERVVDIAHRGGGYHKHILEAGKWKEAVQGYLASIAFADAMLGRLLDALEKSGQAEKTIIVLWSDHGWQLGEKEHWRKFALWENVAKSVLMIHAPKGLLSIPEGSMDGKHCDRIVSLMDIYPTLKDLCNLKSNNRLDGRSLVPLLKKPDINWNYPAITSYDFSEFSIRTERWRYTTYIDGSEELYNHDSDENEWHNLAKQSSYKSVIDSIKEFVPKNPAPLRKTSLKMFPHYILPFKTKEEYQDWLQHGKNDDYIRDKYWK